MAENDWEVSDEQLNIAIHCDCMTTFVTSLFSTTQDLSRLTKRDVRVEYMEYIGCDELSSDERRHLSRVITQLLPQYLGQVLSHPCHKHAITDTSPDCCQSSKVTTTVDNRSRIDTEELATSKRVHAKVIRLSVGEAAAAVSVSSDDVSGEGGPESADDDTPIKTEAPCRANVLQSSGSSDEEMDIPISQLKKNLQTSKKHGTVISTYSLRRRVALYTGTGVDNEGGRRSEVVASVESHPNYDVYDMSNDTEDGHDSSDSDTLSTVRARHKHGTTASHSIDCASPQAPAHKRKLKNNNDAGVNKVIVISDGSDSSGVVNAFSKNTKNALKNFKSKLDNFKVNSFVKSRKSVGEGLTRRDVPDDIVNGSSSCEVTYQSDRDHTIDSD